MILGFFASWKSDFQVFNFNRTTMHTRRAKGNYFQSNAMPEQIFLAKRRNHINNKTIFGDFLIHPDSYNFHAVLRSQCAGMKGEMLRFLCGWERGMLLGCFKQATSKMISILLVPLLWVLFVRRWKTDAQGGDFNVLRRSNNKRFRRIFLYKICHFAESLWRRRWKHSKPVKSPDRPSLGVIFYELNRKTLIVKQREPREFVAFLKSYTPFVIFPFHGCCHSFFASKVFCTSPLLVVLNVFLSSCQKHKTKKTLRKRSSRGSECESTCVHSHESSYQISSLYIMVAAMDRMQKASEENGGRENRTQKNVSEGTHGKEWWHKNMKQSFRRDREGKRRSQITEIPLIKQESSALPAFCRVASFFSIIRWGRDSGSCSFKT